MSAKPVHEIRLGAIKAAIWENKVKGSTRHNVTVQRLYKDEGQWKSSESFGRDDLPLVREVLHRAYVWIFEHGPNSTQTQPAEGSA